MRITEMDECCLSLNDAEDKVHSLRIRKIGQLKRWLSSLSEEYCDLEGISETEVVDMMTFLDYEEWLRRGK